MTKRKKQHGFLIIRVRVWFPLFRIEQFFAHSMAQKTDKDQLSRLADELKKCGAEAGKMVRAGCIVRRNADFVCCEI
jgi:hypothetical protein